MYTDNRPSEIRHLDFLICDLISVCLALYISYGLRHGFKSRYEVTAYINIGLVMVILDLVITFFRDSYKDIVRRGYLKEFVCTFYDCSLVMIGVLVYLYAVQKTIVYSRVTMSLTWLFGLVIMYMFRSLKKLRIRKKLESGNKQSAVFLVCDITLLKDTVDELLSRKYRDYYLVGILLEDSSRKGRPEYSGNEYRKIPILRDSEEITDFVKVHVIDEFFVNLLPDNYRIVEITEMAISMGITVHQNLLAASGFTGERIISDFAGYTVLTSGLKVPRYSDMVVKRLMDLVGGVAGLLITICIFPLVAIAIKRKSPGPVLFSQIRVGKGGRRFRLYKFRSMEVGAEDHKEELAGENMMSGYMFKVHNDPRIIPGVGDFIRKNSIDELPQFWNVVRGDMSLVGTRPPTVEEYEKYDMHHLARMSIKPGITGLWQVSGRNQITDFEEVVRLDKEYIEHWSLYLDVKILIKTLRVVFGSGE